MRTFEVLVSMSVEAESFADAERKTHKIMGDAFNTSDGANPKAFDTLGIIKGQKVVR